MFVKGLPEEMRERGSELVLRQYSAHLPAADLLPHILRNRLVIGVVLVGILYVNN